MAFAQKLTVDANRVTPKDVEGLRTHGLGEEEIFDITLAAAARNLYSKVLNAMGAEPDVAYADTNDLLELVELPSAEPQS
jgi:alkylhydroperoxidase family enzyme